MILVEATFWPLVVVGAVPGCGEIADARSGLEDCRWDTRMVRLAVVISGDHAHAWIAQEEVFGWLNRHRELLQRSVSRVAWVFEDELMRRNADRWLSLIDGHLFGGEALTFCSVRSALSWLEWGADESASHRMHDVPTARAQSER